DDRAEVARVLDAVERDEQRGLAGRRRSDEIVDVGVAERAEPRDHALVARALARRAIELLAIAILDADPRGTRRGHELRDRIAGRFVGAARIDPQRAHPARAAHHELLHGPDAVDAALARLIRCGAAAAAASTAIVAAHVSSAAIARAAAAGSGASRNGRP